MEVTMCTTTMVDLSADSEESVTEAVVAAMAGADGCSPLELDLLLGEHLDPDALEALLGDASATQVELDARLPGYEVRIRSGRDVTVTARCEAPEVCARPVIPA